MGCLRLEYIEQGLKADFTLFLEGGQEKDNRTSKKGFNYYPYGMVMPNRNGSQNDSYRYGFQGQEMDDEIKGKGNSVNYKYRMHDPRVGRFFAVDPIGFMYPHNSPYAFSENVVIHAIELEGLEKDLLWNSPSMTIAKENAGIHQGTAEEKRAHKAFEDGKTMGLAGLGVAGLIFVAVEVGAAATATFILEEGVEFVLEEVTGIPIILDPLDVLERAAKEGFKETGKKIIVEGREFAAGVSLKKIKDWTYNAKNFGREWAQKYADGKITRRQMTRHLPSQSVDDILKSSTLTKGKPNAPWHYYRKSGDFDTALDDFYSLEGIKDIKPLENSKFEGFTGKLSDGSTVTIRSGSSGNVSGKSEVTLEINTKEGASKKVRYGD